MCSQVKVVFKGLPHCSVHCFDAATFVEAGLFKMLSVLNVGVSVCVNLTDDSGLFLYFQLQLVE